jgi:valyl-tRNA synthetase
MAEELSKVYEPSRIEALSEGIWSSGGYFHADASEGGREGRPNYTIVIPPPNITAPLHLGHALNNTLQDILIRFRRMQQCNVLWMPGTDHAGIATQTVVEKRLMSEQGRRRTDFSRDEFLRHIQAWKDEYEKTIIGQLKAMGCSCDWARTRFTMDEVCARAVRNAFFRLFAEGLIYRGKRLVNWDPATQTVLADDELEYRQVRGFFWYLRYPLLKPVRIGSRRIDHVTVATTRPETMLGDTAVAVNPKDPRANHMVGKRLRLPIAGRVIPIIADEAVVLPDAESTDEKARFSTGFLKVTPAHDPQDWEIGKRHNLEAINVLAPDGSISDRHGWPDAAEGDAQFLLGMDRFEARAAVVEYLEGQNLLEDTRQYTHDVAHSYRSHVPVEPYLSDQWFISVRTPIGRPGERSESGPIEGTDIPANCLAGLALKPLADGRLRFVPSRYAKTYGSWLENLRDWPISRQLWWGHRIPIWHKGTEDLSPRQAAALLKLIKRQRAAAEGICFRARAPESQADVDPAEALGGGLKEPIDIYACLLEDDPAEIERLESAGFRRDEDVLDTWFSSALWPFSTLGWPERTPEMAAFYPGDVLCTAREIITLWVSRMVMMGQYCIGEIPFKDVFIHAMIQDGLGRKMSKSLGNGIDPLVVINSHGADAMRFTLASMTTNKQDVRMPVTRMKLPDGRTANTSPKFDLGRNFCNKLWNASRFILANLQPGATGGFDKRNMQAADRWILSALAGTTKAVTAGLNRFKFNEPANDLYRFFWNDFCDWYLEWAKPRLRGGEGPTVRPILAFVLDSTLRLLHPFIPFVTEGIFQKLNEVAPARDLEGLAEAEPAGVLAVARWPRHTDRLIDPDSEKIIGTIQTAVRAIRDLKSKHNRALNERLAAAIESTGEVAEVLKQNEPLICQIARLSRFDAGTKIERAENTATAIVGNMQVYLHGAADRRAERLNLEKKRKQLEQACSRAREKLANREFLEKARAEAVKRTKDQLARHTEQLEILRNRIRHITE